MRKIVLSLITLFLFPFIAFADDVVTFRVTATDGNVKEYELDNISRLTFDKETFVMMFNNSVPEETFRYDDVLNMCFVTMENNAVDNILHDKEGVTITYDGDIISIEGMTDTCRVVIYDIAGRPVLNTVADASSRISTSALTSGVYILKTNNQTFKFNKR